MIASPNCDKPSRLLEKIVNYDRRSPMMELVSRGDGQGSDLLVQLPEIIDKGGEEDGQEKEGRK